jgi:CRP/FNR family transcriptional regulator, cyclic AMP receptor protein
VSAGAGTRPPAGRLRTGSFLAALGAQERAALRTLARPRPYADGEDLLRQGEGGDHVLVLRHGTAKVVAYTRFGTQALLGLRGPGDLLGEIRYLRGTPRTASVVASGPVHALLMDFTALEGLIRRYPSVLDALARCVADRLVWADRRRADFGLPVLVRVSHLLRELAYATNVVPVTQRELGQLVGAAEVSVQKSLRELSRRGWLKRQYGRITLTSTARLAEIPVESGDLIPD